ncbi:hypothetical protein WG66_000943 [Moniliophthora roreri]|nr:hypothetical protein WG66_000943 [Moniliophthora roreri]
MPTVEQVYWLNYNGIKPQSLCLQNGSSPVSAAQVPLPPSPTHSIREDKRTSHHEAPSQPADATGPAEEKTKPTLQ